MDFVKWAFESFDRFMPHEHCLSADTWVVWSEFLSDLAIFAAYMVIPIAILREFLRVENPPPKARAVIVLIGAFVLLCGITHALMALTMFVPVYRIEAVAKILTAIVSVVTAVVIWPAMKDVRSMRDESSLLLRHLDLATDGFWDWHLENDAKYEYMSPSLWKTFGYDYKDKKHSPEEWKSIIFDEDRIVAEEMFVDHLENNTPYKLNVRYRHANGHTVTVFCRGQMVLRDGKPWRMLGSHTDITDLVETRDKFRSLVNAIPFLVFEMNKDGEYLFSKTNGNGYASDEKIVGSRFQDLMPPNAVAALKPAFDAATRGEEVGAVPYRLVHGPEDVRHFKATFRGTATGTVLCIAQDVTEEVRAKIELERTNDRLEKFAYLASHDLQEPLRSMYGPAKILMEDVIDEVPEEYRKWIEFIYKNALRAQRMVKDMLEFSRASTGDSAPEMFNGADAVAEVIEQFHKKIQDNNVKVIVRSIPNINYDRNKFMVVLGNLVSNALKFIRPGSLPEVRIEGGATIGGNVAIRVIDNGIGIPKESMKKIFQPGQRLHSQRDYQGNGLGLSSVAMILERCGGGLDVRSTLGEGTEFKLTVPGGIPSVTG